jgi:hypothetical protein
MFAAWIQVVAQQSVFVLLLLTHLNIPMARKFLVQMELGQATGIFALPHPHALALLPINAGMEHVVSPLEIAQLPVAVPLLSSNVPTEFVQPHLGIIALVLV